MILSPRVARPERLCLSLDSTSCTPFQAVPCRRRGTVAALLALTMVILVGFLGLAIDLGMLAIAKTQAQNAADVAALTASRTVNGDSTNTYNQSAATTNAQNILSYNNILGQTISSSQLTLTYGSYDYNQSTQTFGANFPATTGVPYTAVAATVTSTSLRGAFSTIFGSPLLPNVSATAQAVHRPRDIALVMDLSASMRMGSCLGFDFYTTSRTTNNPDSAIPTFGHYSSNNANLQGPSTSQTSNFDNYTISPSNITAANTSYALTYVNGYYQNAAYASTLVRAFDSYTSTDGGKTWVAPTSGSPVLPPTSYATVPGGDVPLFSNGSTTTYAKTINDVLGSSARNASWELDGYANYVNGSNTGAASGLSSYPSSGNGAFYGYTKGPNYYGKTFFIWPPDPRRPLTTANDATQINAFLTDFGYAAADFNNTVVATTLSAAITNSQTSITVSSKTGFPSSGQYRIVVGSEVMLVTAGAGTTTWTVTRAQDGTSKAAASNGAAVGLATGPPLYGLYGATPTPNCTPPGGQSWPWPNDSGATLKSYLTTRVYIPGGSRLLQTTDAVYQKIMRLYNWNYAIDNLGTTPCDWRVRFFGTDDNTKLFNASGSLNLPSGATYTINYNEILRWIAASSDPFPTQLRAGRIKYYGSIPATVTGSWPSYGSTDQRFWVEYIDYVLGFKQTSAGVYEDDSAMIGYGSDFTWGSVSRTAPPGAPSQYMTYTDNPARPQLRHWFGPLSMVDFLHNFNMWVQTSGYYCKQPADSYEAPLYSAKQAFLAAVTTMQNNHPNDWVSTICFSWPRTGANSNWSLTGNAVSGRFNCVSCPLGTNYAYARSALLFPFSTINADGTPNNTEITPYDPDPSTGAIPSANFVDTPRPDGETCFSMGLMLAYNQFAVTTTSDKTLRSFVTSTPITFPSGMAGGMGRKGAQKLIIFETDGLANTTATASLVNAGTYKYYSIRYDMNKPSTSEYPSCTNYGINNSTVLNEVYGIVQQLATDYGTTRNPFRLYALGFGPVFASGAPDRTNALTTLQTMQYYAGTQANASTALPSNQIITGTDSQMSSNMISAYTSILQNSVQIALIK
jgi:Flp pilus assembly protein TadG